MKMKFRIFAIILFIIISKTCCEEDELILIKKLREELLNKRKYDKISRPVKQHQTPTWLKLQLTVVHFSDLDISKHILTTEAWLRMVWTDEHLTWNTNDFGISEIHFGADELWKPDITLWNSADNNNLDENLAKTHLIVNSNGTVTWLPPATFRTSCPLDLTNYPFDEQYCEIYFGSWSHSTDKINITTLGEHFLEDGPWYSNPEWQLTDFGSFRNEFDYPGYGAYSSLGLWIRLKRNASFYYFTITLPSIAAMILILTIFWLPLHSNVRFTLASTSLFISLSILLFLGMQLGSASIGVPLAVRNVSLLVIMVGIALILSTVSHHIFIACINSNLTVPQFLVDFLKGIFGQLICVGNSCINISKPINLDRMQLTPEDANGANLENNLDSNITNENEWVLLFTFIDRLLFLIYFIVFITKHA